jgi:ubiquinone/menaquinone biosynthesis C-methylase UbiE
MRIEMTDYLNHKNDFDSPDIASLVDELSFWSSRFGSMLFDQIEIRKSVNILDVGCATGFPLFELAHVFGDSSHVTGIDIWQHALDRARFKLKTYGLQNVTVIEADGAHQPFPDSEFDLITSNLGINNWADPLGVLNECFRVAKPDATILLTTNVVGHYKEFYEVFRNTLVEMNKSECVARLSAQEEHRGTRESHCAVLEKAGWVVVKIVENSFEMRFADGNALFNHSLTKLGFLDGWKSVVERMEQTKVFTRVEQKLDQIAQHDGELRMTVPMLCIEGINLPASGRPRK